MKIHYKLIYLILILTLNVSCIKKKSIKKGSHESELVSSVQTDSLKFTSGIRAILQDSKGNYWFGSHQEGVGLFNGKSFEYFTINDGLSDNQIRSIHEDKSGVIWFGTANGVCSYNKGIITNHMPIKNEISPNDWTRTSNELWFNAGNRDGVYKYDGLKLNFLAFPFPGKENLNTSYGVTDISKDQNGNVWIATYTALFNFDDKTIHVFDSNKLALKDGEMLHIRSVLADSKGRIWIGNNGLGVLLLQGNSTINFSDKNGLIHPNSGKNGHHSPVGTLEHVFVIEEDSEGNIWFGDRDTGAWKFDGKTMTNYTVDDTLSTPMIWSIYNDQNNNLLFGMADGGVYQFNGESFNRTF